MSGVGGRPCASLSGTGSCPRGAAPRWRRVVSHAVGPSPRMGHGCVPFGDGHLVLFGGVDWRYSAELWLYDAETEGWAKWEVRQQSVSEAFVLLYPQGCTPTCTQILRVCVRINAYAQL